MIGVVIVVVVFEFDWLVVPACPVKGLGFIRSCAAEGDGARSACTGMIMSVIGFDG